jgi:hypothetical protein
MNDQQTEDPTSSEQPSHPRVPEAPPVVRPPKTPRRAVWPLVLGIMGLIFAGIQTIGVLVNITASLVSGNYESIIENLQPGLTGDWLIFGVFWLVVQLAVLVCLYFAAFGLILRRKWGITASRIYAACLIVTSIVNTIVTVLRWDSIKDNPDIQNLPAQFPMEGFMIISMGFSIVFAVGIAAGVFIWLRSGAARREWSTW